eukprot:scaffold3.g6254.t1
MQCPPPARPSPPAPDARPPAACCAACVQDALLASPGPAFARARQLASAAAALGRGGLPADELPVPDAEPAAASAAAAADADTAEALEEAELPSTSDAAAAGAAPDSGDSISGSGGDYTIDTLPLGRGLHQAASVAGQRWVFETGRLARVADGACLVQAGGTTVLAGAVCEAQAPRRDPRGLQLEVDYREKLFAVGRIPGGYNKREGAPREAEIYASVLSADGEQDPEVLAINAASAALTCSDVPWGGPVAAARVALGRGGELRVNPPAAEAAGARLSLLLAVAEGGRVVMMEGLGEQVPEAELLAAVRAGAEAAAALLPPQRALAARTGRRKRRVLLAGADPAAAQKVQSLAREEVEPVLRNPHLGRNARAAALQAAKEHVLAAVKASGAFRAGFARVPGSGCVSQSDLDHAFAAVVGRLLREMALEEGLRCDGRGLLDVRPIHCELDAIPVVHGSALFTRGETQSLCTVTVGTRAEQQRTETLLGGGGSKGLFVNYSFSGMAVNETAASGLRRELGHSALVERALAPALPSVADFPFTLRLNADTLSSSGSSSMAAVCGGALALVDAGVPLSALVAGVSVGLLRGGGAAAGGAAGAAGGGRAGAAAPAEEWGRYELLVDLLGMEDQLGDMDLKLAGGWQHEGCQRVAKEGAVYAVRVVGLRDYGAFVELEATGMRALLHISELAATRVRAVEDVLAVGQSLEVLCIGRDARGNVKLSRKALLARRRGEAAAAAAAAAPEGAPGGGADPGR